MSVKTKPKRLRTTNDVISDLLTRMRNAIAARHDSVFVKRTKMVLEILNILSNYRFIGGYSLLDSGDVQVFLKVNGVYRISQLERVSRPGLRIYVKSSQIKLVKGGKGLGILTTSKGVVSNLQARRLNVGGELICRVW